VKKRFVDELSEGELIQDVFLVKQSSLKTTKSGSLFLSLVLADRSGPINAVLWDASRQLYESFAPDDFIMVRANVEAYMDKPQLVVSHLKRVEEKEISLADFLPASDRDPEEMLEELREIVAEVKNPALGALLKSFFEDEEFAKAFARCPAAVSLHHAYLGGLLQHTLGVARMALDVTERYPILDRDILLTGALLHDLGKVEEIEHHRAFKYSDRGALLGHLTIGAAEVGKRAGAIKDFPPEKLMQIQHLILSHHGQFEFGSPKLPMTAEAMALHYLDNLDAKMEALRVAEPVDGNWTGRMYMFDNRRMFVGQGGEDAK